MSIFKRVSKDASKKVGTLAGNYASRNAQNATNITIDGMSLFRQKVFRSQNISFDIAKGSLFEYIEAAKFNKNAASVGSSVKAIVNDARGEPHAVADIIIKDQGKTVKQIQAKFVQRHNEEGLDRSALFSVKGANRFDEQRLGQYDGMTRLIRKQKDYNPEGSLLDEAKKLAKASAKPKRINSEYYQDVYENLTDETTHKGVTSGGTTIEEVKKAYDTPRQYGEAFEQEQVTVEMKITVSNMIKASVVTTGIVSSISNIFEVLKGEKELGEAIKDVGADAAKGGIRGGATGAISTAIRYKGAKAGSALFSDSTAATLMAGGIIDSGVALFSYAKGEINEEELKDELVDTTVKAVTTIYFTKAITAILGNAVNPFVPMAVYTTASYVITCTREIINNANLNAEEYNRIAAILQESTRVSNEYHEQLKQHIAQYEEKQRIMFDEYINAFNYNLETGENYDEALYAIVNFANHAGIALQHVDREEFNNAMNSDEAFLLQ